MSQVGSREHCDRKGMGVRDGAEGLLRDQDCRRMGSTGSASQPFEDLFLEDLTILGIAYWFSAVGRPAHATAT